MRAELQATFDAGALVLHAADHTWVKLALERSRRATAMIVSVVTRGLSDDANGRVVTGDGVWLRVSRIGAACALHASDDGERWELVRHFALDAPDGLAAGFLAQSPTGEGCTRHSTTCASWRSRWPSCATAPRRRRPLGREREGLALSQLRAGVGQLSCLQEQGDVAIGGRAVHGLPGGRQRHEVAVVGSRHDAGRVLMAFSMR